MVICRAGLAHHPDNLTARVTMGRALIEIDRLDEALTELTFVLDAAPENLPAIRAVAEIHQRRGMMSDALVYYRRALQLAQHDTDLSNTVQQIQLVVEAPTRRDAPAPPPQPIEALFDFDSLIAQLNATREILSAPTFAPHAPSPIETAVPDPDDDFAQMERQLREREEQRLIEERQARQAEAERKRKLVLQELEDWLAAVVHDRRSRPSA